MSQPEEEKAIEGDVEMTEATAEASPAVEASPPAPAADTTIDDADKRAGNDSDATADKMDDVDEEALDKEEEKPESPGMSEERPATTATSAPAPPPSAKSKSLREFLGMMDEYAPIIPDAVTDYYLNAAGFDCEDKRVKRLLALAAQKFISDIAQDAYQHSKIRASNTGGNAGAGGAPNAPRGKYGKDRARVVLSMDDLAAGVQEYGINLKRPEFWR